MLERVKVINRNALKYIVIVLMVLDHIAHSLGDTFPLYLPFRFISRLTGPIMAIFIAEGYHYTRDVKKYALRLGIFAIISTFALDFYLNGSFATFSLLPGNTTVDYGSYIYLPFINSTFAIYTLSVIYTLLLGLICIWMWDKAKFSNTIKILLTLVILYLSSFGDWCYWDILYCLAFYFFRERPKLKWSSFCLISLLYIFELNPLNNAFAFKFEPEFILYRVGTLLVPLVMILFYNGKSGSKSAFNKWFFYVFYPLHFIILALIFN